MEVCYCLLSMTLPITSHLSFEQAQLKIWAWLTLMKANTKWGATIQLIWSSKLWSGTMNLFFKWNAPHFGSIQVSVYILICMCQISQKSTYVVQNSKQNLGIKCLTAICNFSMQFFKRVFSAAQPFKLFQMHIWNVLLTNYNFFLRGAFFWLKKYYGAY